MESNFLYKKVEKLNLPECIKKLGLMFDELKALTGTQKNNVKPLVPIIGADCLAVVYFVRKYQLP